MATERPMFSFVKRFQSFAPSLFITIRTLALPPLSVNSGRASTTTSPASDGCPSTSASLRAIRVYTPFSSVLDHVSLSSGALSINIVFTSGLARIESIFTIELF